MCETNSSFAFTLVAGAVPSDEVLATAVASVLRNASANATDLQVEVVNVTLAANGSGSQLVTVPLSVTATLALAGDGVPATELAALESSLQQRVADFVRTLSPGGTLRQARGTA